MPVTRQIVSISPSIFADKPRNTGRLKKNGVFIVSMLGIMLSIFVFSFRASQETQMDIGPRRLDKRQAEHLAKYYCRVLTGNRVVVIDTIGYDSAPGVANPVRQTWEVTSQDKTDRYFVEINADSSELTLFHRQRNAISSVESASQTDRVRPLPRNRALYIAKRYLSLANLSLPANATMIYETPGFSFSFQLLLSMKQKRLLQVRVDPFDGHLETLRNVVYRSIQK